MKRIALLAALALGALSLNAGVSFSSSATSSPQGYQVFPVSVPAAATASTYIRQTVSFVNWSGSYPVTYYQGLGVSILSGPSGNVYQCQSVPYSTVPTASATASIAAGDYSVVHINQNGTYTTTTISW